MDMCHICPDADILLEVGNTRFGLAQLPTAAEKLIEKQVVVGQNITTDDN